MIEHAVLLRAAGLLSRVQSAFRMDSQYARAGAPAVELTGSVALLAFALFWLLSLDVSQIAEGVLIALFLWVLWHGPRRDLVRDPLVVLVLVWILYQFLFVAVVVREFPELATEQIRYARQYAKVGLIPLIAWWLGGSVRAIALVLGLAAVGFVVGVTFRDGGVLDSIEAIAAQQRLGLGYRNWEHVAVYAAFALLALVGLSRQIAALFGARQWVAYLLMGGGAIYCLWIVVITQTRAVWLGLVVSIVAATAAALFTRNRRDHGGDTAKGSRRGMLWMIAGMVAVTVTMVLVFDIHKLIDKRLEEEQHVVAMVLKGDLANVPLSSVGIRMVMWHQAFAWIAERPFLGWGPKTRDYLFENGELPTVIPDQYGIHHFHNQAIELAIAYGMIGVFVFAAILMIVVRTAWRAWQDGTMPRDVMLYGVAALAFWLTVNLFESYFNYTTGIYINALLGGAFYTFRFAEARA